MLFKQIFIDAIADVLKDTKYYLIDDSFYIYKREIGIVICLGFDVLLGGWTFYIAGGAASFCNNIELLPDHQLAIHCYDVNEYVEKCKCPSIENVNFDKVTGNPKRYTKALFIPKLRENIVLLKDRLLPDLLHIESLEDYYRFLVHADRTDYYIPIPLPSENTFFLCISLKKIREASHVYLLMLKQDDPAINSINQCMQLESEDIIFDALRQAASGAVSNKEAYTKIEDQAQIIEDMLRKHQNLLEIELQRRITNSREICERYFSE